jgi:hypothetical protein
MSKYDKEREALGIKSVGASSFSSNKSSKYSTEREALLSGKPMQPTLGEGEYINKEGLIVPPSPFEIPTKTPLSQSRYNVVGQSIIPRYQEDKPLQAVGKDIVNYGLGTVGRIFGAPQQALMQTSRAAANVVQGKPQDFSEMSFGKDVLGAKEENLLTTAIAMGLDPTTYIGGGILDDLSRAGQLGKGATLGTAENLAANAATGQRAAKGIPLTVGKELTPTRNLNPLYVDPRGTVVSDINRPALPAGRDIPAKPLLLSEGNSGLSLPSRAASKIEVGPVTQKAKQINPADIYVDQYGHAATSPDAFPTNQLRLPAPKKVEPLTQVKYSTLRQPVKSGILSTEVGSMSKPVSKTNKLKSPIKTYSYGGDYAGVKIVEIPEGGKTHFELGDDGIARLYAPDAVLRDKNYIRTRLFRYIDDYLNPLEDDVYIRMTNKIEDYEHVKNKTHRGSFNNATDEAEGGLSASKSPEFPAKYGYFVKGKKIGNGTDGEPLLDLSTVEPISKPMSWDKMYNTYKQRLIKKASEMGLTEDDVKNISLGKPEFDNIERIPETPLQKGVEKKISQQIGEGTASIKTLQPQIPYKTEVLKRNIESPTRITPLEAKRLKLDPRNMGRPIPAGEYGKAGGTDVINQLQPHATATGLEPNMYARAKGQIEKPLLPLQRKLAPPEIAPDYTLSKGRIDDINAPLAGRRLMQKEVTQPRFTVNTPTGAKVVDTTKFTDNQGRTLSKALQGDEVYENLTKELQGTNVKSDAAIKDIAPMIKDKSGLTLNLKDVYRNMRDAFGRAFPHVKKNYLDPLDASKGKYVDEVEKYTDDIYNNVVKKLGINKGSKESAAVQWFGEKKRIAGVEKTIDRRQERNLIKPQRFRILWMI